MAAIVNEKNTKKLTRRLSFLTATAFTHANGSLSKNAFGGRSAKHMHPQYLSSQKISRDKNKIDPIASRMAGKIASDRM